MCGPSNSIGQRANQETSKNMKESNLFGTDCQKAEQPQKIGSYRVELYELGKPPLTLGNESFSSRTWSKKSFPISIASSLPVKGMSLTEMRIEDYYLMRSRKLTP